MTVHSDENLETQIAAWRELHAAPTGRARHRRRGARGPPAGIDHRPDAGGPATRRGVPGRGQADGQPRQPFSGVRAGALRTLVEAAGASRRPNGSPTPTGSRSRPAAGRVLRCSGCPQHQSAGAVRPRLRRRRELLPAQHQPVRAGTAHGILRHSAAGHRAGRRHPAGAVRARRRRRQHLSAGRELAEHRAHGNPSADRAVARRRCRVRRR